MLGIFWAVSTLMDSPLLPCSVGCSLAVLHAPRSPAAFGPDRMPSAWGPEKTKSQGKSSSRQSEEKSARLCSASSRLVWTAEQVVGNHKTPARLGRRRQWRPRPASGSPSSPPEPAPPPPPPPRSRPLAAFLSNAAPPTVTTPTPITSPSLPASSLWTSTGCVGRPRLSPPPPSPAPAIPIGCLVSHAFAGGPCVN
jgi:hypothetical protein